MSAYARSNIIDLTVHVHHDTDRAVLVSLDGDRENAVWLPLSAVEIEPVRMNGHTIVSLPEHLAVEKGLV